MINIINAKFLSSSTNLKDCADYALSEIALLGRSNVGKSSLINALCNQNSLAKSSSTPGKTRLINFFQIEFINENKEKSKAILVDLPGFGYAKVSKNLQDEWKKNLSHFLQNRLHIRLFLHLIDARHSQLENDINLSQFLYSFLKPDQQVLKIYTKSDKINQSIKSKILAKDKNALLVSSLNKVGIDKLKEEIFKMLFNAHL